MTASPKKRKVTVRVAHSWEEAEQFDREWWAKYTPDEKVAMVWELTKEAYAIAGRRVQQRLSRSTCHVQRRRR